MPSEMDPFQFEAKPETMVGLSDLNNYSVVLSKDEALAIEGWRQANGFSTSETAICALLRIALLSELSQSQSVLDAVRQAVQN